MKPAVSHLQAASSNSVQTRRVIKCLQGAGFVLGAWGGSQSPLASPFVGLPPPHPPLQSSQFQRDFGENPKRISFGGLNHRCSFREEPVTERNCKDTLSHITYVFTELTKLPNQLLCWALKLRVWPCTHTCPHTAFFPYRCCFPHARKTWYGCCIVIFLSHCSILWLHLFQLSPKQRKKGISKYIQLRNYFWVK